MHRTCSRIVAMAGLTAGVASVAQMGDSPYPHRWVYVSRSLAKDTDVEDIRAVAETAREHGLNGMVLSGQLESVARWDAARLARIEAVQGICGNAGLEIIPIIWSVGYGSGLGVDRNLAAGLPCRQIPFVAAGGRLRFEPSGTGGLANPGFEQYDGNRSAGYRFHDRPGEVSFVDTDIRHGGLASLRFQDFGRFEHGHARVMQEIQVRPHRQYRLGCWVRTEELTPTSAFRLQVYGPKGSIAPVELPLESTADWKRVSFVFNSLENDSLRLYAGLWGGRSGRFWLDDLELEEIALVNLLRRAGTPLTVASADGQTIYEEGRDYEPPRDGVLDPRNPHAAEFALYLTPASRIMEGHRVQVSYYHGMAINRGQVSVCMSEPALYAYWRESAAAIRARLNPRTWFLSMDEIRAGGSCAACQARGIGIAEILGQCITEQVRIIREVSPEAMVAIWSDMLDPHHNARPDYYLVQGDLSGGWQHVPKDLLIVCWYYSKRNDSMPFFAAKGFGTLAGAYYDGDTLDNIEGWIETANQTPACSGIMYTTWQNKYALLPDFGRLLRERSRPLLRSHGP